MRESVRQPELGGPTTRTLLAGSVLIAVTACSPRPSGRVQPELAGRWQLEMSSDTLPSEPVRYVTTGSVSLEAHRSTVSMQAYRDSVFTHRGTFAIELAPVGLEDWRQLEHILNGCKAVGTRTSDSSFVLVLFPSWETGLVLRAHREGGAYIGRWELLIFAMSAHNYETGSFRLMRSRY